MRGLLDFIKTPEGQGLLAAVAGGMAGARRGEPVNSLGRAGLAGLAGYSGAMDRQDQQANAAFNQQFRQMQMDALKQQQEQQKAQQAWRAGLPEVINQATMPVYGAGEEGPTMAPPDPQKLQSYLMDPASPFADKVLEQKLFPKQGEAFTLGPGQTRYGPDGKPVASMPERINPNQPFMVKDGEIVPNPAYQQYELEKAERGRSNVSVTNSVNTAGRRDDFWGDAPSGMVWARDGQGRIITEQDAATGAVTPRAVKIGGTNTQAQSEVDKKFAAEYADFVAGGGVADVEKQLTQLNGVIAQLSTNPTLSGPFRGLLPDNIRAITNPEAVAAKNAVEEVVQRSLRVVLGAQFTAEEGERLIARAYNPQLSPEENQVRVTRLAEQIKKMAESKLDAARYFEKYGTLQGWQGRLPTLSDIDLGQSAGKAPQFKIPQAAINELKMRRNDPAARRQFDGIFGEGAADRVLGGK